jgi:hypothetical protein
VRQSGGAFHLANDRIKRAVGTLRGAEIAQSRVQFRSNALQQCRRQAGLADTRFSREQHHLSFASLRFRPTPQQQFQFFFPPDKLSYAARVQGLKAALH